MPGGQITGLIGPNGAGKTTLLNIISGVERASAGRVLLQGHDIGALPQHRLAARGLVRTFQISRDLGQLTVLENLLLARPRWWSLGAGSVLALSGVGIRALSSGHVKKNEELATTGPYAYTRNPLYFGSIVIAAGLALAALRWEIAIGLLILFAAIYWPVTFTTK